MSAIKVSVTQEDINNAERSCSECPVALAVTREIGVTQHEMVTANIAYIAIRNRVGMGMIRSWNTSQSVSRFMSRFDSGLPVKPFKFELRGEVIPYDSLQP